MRWIPMAVAIVAVIVLTSSARAEATGGEGEAWPVFTESSACGAQRVSTPLADRQGWLGRTDLLRGEFAGMFGRSVDDVFSHLVRWSIPGSTEWLAVHERILPAYEDVADALDTSIRAGGHYPIRGSTTYSTAARTIGGNWRISRHTFGAAVDINAHANPNRGDNELITDMPEWWVDAFLDAGFCWGGLWVGSKDTMHFAWQGPAFSGYEELPTPYAPLTEPRPLVLPTRRIPVVPVAPQDTIATVLADTDTNGARDVVRIAQTPDGLLVDSSLASLGHSACSSRRSLVAGLGDLPTEAHTLGFGDWDGRGGQDLWLIDDVDGYLRLTVRTAFGDYAAEIGSTTSIPMPGDDAWVSTGDFDADGSLDLVIIDEDIVSVWAVDPYTGASHQLLTTANPIPGAQQYFLGDADLDARPDLWALRSGTIAIATAADGYGGISDEQRPLGLPSGIVDIVASDYDGDGRTDLMTFDGTAKTVWLANSPMSDGLPPEVWFEYPDAECEERLPSQNLEDLQFTSNGWIAEGSHGWRLANGFSVGCDPENDACTPPIVTARSLAEFFAWIDGLEPSPLDDADTAAPRAVIGSGYRVPCASGDDACWNRPLLRTEVSYYFGRFLADRRGDVPEPHRWVLPMSEDAMQHTPH